MWAVYFVAEGIRHPVELAESSEAGVIYAGAFACEQEWPIPYSPELWEYGPEEDGIAANNRRTTCFTYRAVCDGVDTLFVVQEVCPAR